MPFYDAAPAVVCDSESGGELSDGEVSVAESCDSAPASSSIRFAPGHCNPASCPDVIEISYETPPTRKASEEKPKATRPRTDLPFSGEAKHVNDYKQAAARYAAIQLAAGLGMLDEEVEIAQSNPSDPYLSWEGEVRDLRAGETRGAVLYWAPNLVLKVLNFPDGLASSVEPGLTVAILPRSRK